MSTSSSSDGIRARDPAPEQLSLRPGDRLGGRYELRRGIGSGGYSNVLEALDTQTQRSVAIKLLKHDAGNNDPSANARMRQEASLLEGIRHSNVVATYDYVVDKRMTYIVMEFIPGLSLAHIIYNEGPAPSERVLPIAKQMLSALQACHDKGILHRDIKPENIIISPSEDPALREIAKIVDFGLAKPYTPSTSLDDSSGQITFVRTRAGGFLGTPRYTPPEQAVGDPIGPFTDLFALALVLAEFLTGQVRLKGNTHSELMSLLLGPDPIDVSDCPRVWHTWLARLLSKDPKARPQSAKEALYELEESVEIELMGGVQPGEFEFDSERGAFIPSTNPGLLALDQRHASFLDSDEPLELDLEAARQTRRPARPSPHMFTPMNAQGPDAQPLDAVIDALPSPGDLPAPGAPDSTAAIPIDRPSSRTMRRREVIETDDSGSLVTIFAVGLLSCIGVLLALFALMLLRSALF